MKKNTGKSKINPRILFGYLIIIFGVSLPLSGFFSMTVKEAMRDSFYRDFKETKKDFDIKSYEDYDSNMDENNLVDPFLNEDYEPDRATYGKSSDEVFAYLIIPKLELKKPVYLGASEDHLKKGLAQVDGTALPSTRKNRRCVIAGHRGGYGDLMFYNIHLLEEGDQVSLDLGNRTIDYRVTDKEIIKPNEWEKLQPRVGENTLTLLSCDPLHPPRPRRILVNCRLVEDEVNAQPVETEVAVDDSRENISKRSKGNLYLIYLITFSLIAIFILYVFKFFRYIFKGE